MNPVSKKPQARANRPATIAQIIRRVAGRFARARLYFGHGTETALDEAAWLVGHVAGVAPSELEAHPDATLTAAQAQHLEQLTRARITTRAPLAYLLHEAWFAGRRYYVDERVLVPRSLIGEFIVERFQPWIDAGRVRRVIDIGTGSGCIAIALARAFTKARVDATDISRAALAVAKINVARHRLGRRVRLVESDVYAALDRTRYDVIVSNPPYVARRALTRLPAEYRHEPAGALAAGRDGLEIIERLLTGARAHLQPGGLLVVETGNSCARVAKRFPLLPFTWLTTERGDESVFLLTAEQLPAPDRLLPCNALA